MEWAPKRFLRRARWPRTDDPDIQDFARGFHRFVLPGYVPESPPLLRSDAVFTQGSCFAEEISKALDAKGIQTAFLHVGEEINSPLANRLLFEYALTDLPYALEEHTTSFPRDQGRMRDLLRAVKLFVLTLGVGFCPFRDGHLTANIMPTELQDVSWRMLSPEEHAAHIQAIVKLIRAVNPTLRIVLSVSPIPLKNAFTHDSVVVADCLSKSSLRTAAELVVTSGIPDVFYWPSFEAIRWLPGHSGAVFGVEDAADHRHIASKALGIITDAFIAAYFQPAR